MQRSASGWSIVSLYRPLLRAQAPWPVRDVSLFLPETSLLPPKQKATLSRLALGRAATYIPYPTEQPFSDLNAEVTPTLPSGFLPSQRPCSAGLLEATIRPCALPSMGVPAHEWALWPFLAGPLACGCSLHHPHPRGAGTQPSLAPPPSPAQRLYSQHPGFLVQVITRELKRKANRN